MLSLEKKYLDSACFDDLNNEETSRNSIESRIMETFDLFSIL